ncbi:DUF881 domain-containing protein [Amphibacillus xylanus]|uniref:DUF881 domain-containing protein n=1 Tax=Amphibacillus xylanus (strain ATCC 51415 / DSM 6626 / JCM 7361 / LMG 17667 / NBRC 15112 / Ep01) TaxID=698758 RepID=K0IZ27_AMPXN|nr:DUF881 domain-containing protein [Amphibacillus xylanus]BAM47714.1 hypothetical protein AXY_15820 [Amphibacillus xylanus NBRC 15112]
MHRNQIIVFSIATFIIGLMLAIYFNKTPDQPLRETRDMWEIRMQLQEEQNTQQALQNELNELKSIESQYLSRSEKVQIEALSESMENLKEKAGIVTINEPGVIIRLDSMNGYEDDAFDFGLTPELLNRLINELNSYGAKHIAIQNERVTNFTAIRYVGDRIHINQRPIPDLPLTVKVASDDPDRLLSYIEVSQSRDEFAMYNIQFNLEKREDINIPAYDKKIQLDYVEVVEEDKVGGE